MDGLPLSLAFVVGHIKVDEVAFPILIIHHDVVGEIQGVDDDGLHGLVDALPFSDLHGKGVKRPCHGDGLPELHPPGEDQGEGEQDNRDNENLPSPGPFSVDGEGEILTSRSVSESADGSGKSLARISISKARSAKATMKMSQPSKS